MHCLWCSSVCDGCSRASRLTRLARRAALAAQICNHPHLLLAPGDDGPAPDTAFSSGAAAAAAGALREALAKAPGGGGAAAAAAGGGGGGGASAAAGGGGAPAAAGGGGGSPVKAVLDVIGASGKMAALEALLSRVLADGARAVVVSTSTATLDLIDTLLCQPRGCV